MRLYLRNKIASLVWEVKHIKELEKHHLANGRGLRGVFMFSKKHPKGKFPPVPDETSKEYKKFKRQDDWGDQVNDPEVLQKAVNTEYYKFWGLERYRKNELRPELRHSHLALGFLRDLSYSRIESAGCYILPDFDRVERMVKKFTEEDRDDWHPKFTKWKEDALIALSGVSSESDIDITVAA